jgi:hypothetical protein
MITDYHKYEDVRGKWEKKENTRSCKRKAKLDSFLFYRILAARMANS